MESSRLVIEKLTIMPDKPPMMRLSGPLVLSTLSEFQNKVFAEHSQNLILDISDVPYMDSSGIGALMALYVRQHRAGYPVHLLGATDRVREVLKISRVDQFFDLLDRPSDDQANCA